MPALVDLPEIVGFYSYSRDDDQEFGHSLTAIRTIIQNELRARLGRSRQTLRLWQDQEALPPGALWESQIHSAIDQSVFFIPIVTPRVLNSKYCNTEFQRFLDRERRLGRDDLVFPILYIDVDELEDESKWRGHPVLEVIGQRQYVDWREYRFDLDSPAVRRGIAAFAATVVSTLRRPMAEPWPAEAKTPPIEQKAIPPKVADATPPIDEVVAAPPAIRIPHQDPMPEPKPPPIPAKSRPVDLRTWSLIVGVGILVLVGVLLLLGRI